MSEFTVAALYKFTRFPDFRDQQEPIKAACLERGICGTLLLADEGINGTIAGSEAGIQSMVAFLEAIPAIGELEVKYSTAAEQPFKRMKVRLKEEIVRMGVPGIDPNRTVGTYVEPEDWNALISDPETLVIDTRNSFEFDLGTFKVLLIPTRQPLASFQSGRMSMSAHRESEMPGRLPCFVRVASAVRKRSPTSKNRGMITFITSKVAF